MRTQTNVPAITDEEIHQLLRDIEEQVATLDARINRPRAYSASSVKPELTVDEILRKVQRDIANG
jgi:hypothetical protein